jgi:hypothetical protein
MSSGADCRPHAARRGLQRRLSPPLDVLDRFVRIFCVLLIKHQADEERAERFFSERQSCHVTACRLKSQTACFFSLGCCIDKTVYVSKQILKQQTERLKNEEND